MKKALSFFCGIIVGSIFFGSALSFAAIGKKNVDVKYSDIKVVVQSKIVRTSQEPFILDGRVYVPLRAVAEALEQEVAWENNTVLIGKGKQSLVLPNLLSYDRSGIEVLGDTTKINLNGKDTRGFCLKGGKMRPEGYIKFNVNGKGVKEVKGSISLDNSNPKTIPPVEIKILKDDKIVWEGTIQKGENPVPVSIKLQENTSNLTFQFSNLEETKINFIDFIALY